MESARTLPIADQSVGVSKTMWERAKTGLIVLSIVGLGVSNILTIVSDDIHAAAFGVIRAILSSGIGNEAMSRILSKSPMAKRAKYVAKATELLRKENLSLSESNMAIVSKHATLEKAHKEVNIKHAELTRVSGLRASAAKSFTKRLATRSAIGATRTMTTIPGKALPYIGAGIVVAVTSLDLYDACETLKDINALNSEFGTELEDQTQVCGMKVPTRQQVMSQIKGNIKGTYELAAELLNKGGGAIPTTTPIVSWSDVKDSVCTLIGDRSIPCR